MEIIDHAIDDCHGKVSLQNYKGKYATVVPTSSVEFTETEEGTDIVIYVVLKFGASIDYYTKYLLNRLYDDIESIMGERPRSVKVVVTGVQSKNIGKRHIEITELGR